MPDDRVKRPEKRTCCCEQEGQNHLASPAGRSFSSIGGFKHHRW